MKDQIITIIITIIASTGFWSFITFVVQKIFDKESLEKKALQALLRDRLLSMYKKYKTEGLSVEDKANFENCYTIYHRLGKNGVMDGIYSEVMKMEVN